MQRLIKALLDRPTMDVKSIPDLASCGLNMPAPDLLTPIRSAAAIWSWAEGHPFPSTQQQQQQPSAQQQQQQQQYHSQEREQQQPMWGNAWLPARLQSWVPSSWQRWLPAAVQQLQLALSPLNVRSTSCMIK